MSMLGQCDRGTDLMQYEPEFRRETYWQASQICSAYCHVLHDERQSHKTARRWHSLCQYYIIQTRLAYTHTYIYIDVRYESENLPMRHRVSPIPQTHHACDVGGCLSVGTSTACVMQHSSAISSEPARHFRSGVLRCGPAASLEAKLLTLI